MYVKQTNLPSEERMLRNVGSYFLFSVVLDDFFIGSKQTTFNVFLLWNLLSVACVSKKTYYFKLIYRFLVAKFDSNIEFECDSYFAFAVVQFSFVFI